MHILVVVNSFLGKKGNVGFRVAKIYDAFDNSVAISAIARGKSHNFSYNVYTPGVLGHFPRLLKAIQLYIYNGLNYRYLDAKMFEFFFCFIFLFFIRFSKDFVRNERKIAHLVEPSPLIVEILKRYGYKVFLDIPIAPSNYVKKLKSKGLGYGFFYNKKIDLMEQKSLYLSDFIIVPSPFVADEVQNIIGRTNDTIIVPFGVDLSNLSTDILKPSDCNNREKKGVDFCFAGVINYRKGVNTLLEAWDCEEFKNDTLHLCGRLTPEIARLLKVKNYKNITTPGFIDTMSYFLKCDVYVFPSLLEGSSKSIYEAMASRMPIITTYESGSIVKDGVDGYVIPHSDAEILRNKMIYLKMNKVKLKSFGDNAFKTVSSYSWKNYSNRFVTIFNKV
jgi:glycosyltransferase involved in cell wall biosynthesis